MHSRMSEADIQAFEGVLIYDRFNVHVYGDKLKANVDELTVKLDRNQDEINPRLKKLYKQLSIYFAFHKRDLELANKYLQKYHSCCDTDLEKAEAASLMGYANTIDPNYKDEKIFEATLSLLPPENQNEDIQVKIIRAFALQYKALMLHRQAIANKSTHLDNALEIISQAISMQRSIQDVFPSIKIGLAESLHIKGVILSRLGDALDKTYFVTAEKVLSEAAELEKEFCKATHAQHFLLAATLQSNAIVLANLGDYQTALDKLLKDAYEIQQIIYKTNIHPDVAKTWHFKGDVCVKKGDYVGAIDAYLIALILKKQIPYKDDYMVNVTQQALEKSLKSLSADNHQIVFVQYKKVYDALTGEMRNSFINKDERFTDLIRDKMNECRDKISIQANTASSSNRFPFATQSIVPIAEKTEQLQPTKLSNT